MRSEWRFTTVGDTVDINPSYRIKKGELAKKIAMEDLEPFTRKVKGYSIAEFNGGSRFQNGDTLLARITPCLENGKTAFVNVLEPNEIGFGSTEFIVLRGKEGVTDNKFVYYLSISPEFRNVAIKSMTGTSGRQRAQIDAISKWQYHLPPLQEQRELVALLSSLDDKIELNIAINKNLEEMAQALFKKWFVDFEFPNDDGEPYKSSGGEFEDSELGPIPKGWRPGTIGELGEVVGGATPSKKVDAYYTDRGIPWITPKDLSKTTNKYIARGEIDISEEGFNNSSVNLLPRGTVLFSSRAPIGYVAIAKNEVTTNQGFKSVIPLKHIGSEFVYYFLKSNVDTIESRASGSTFKEISGSEMRKVPVLIPPEDVLAKFNEIVEPLGRLIQKCEEENETLSQLRDTLLPKLMSGEIRVPVEQEQVQAQEQEHSIYQPSYNDLPMAAENKADYQI